MVANGRCLGDSSQSRSESSKSPLLHTVLFAVPERELGVLGPVDGLDVVELACGTADVLGPVHGLDVVELACGTAYFSAWLARAGAMTVAVDISHEQLMTARRMQTQIGPVFPLVQGDGERIPLASGRYDLVVSEHGAAVWCDPEQWLPEAAPSTNQN